MKKMITLAMTFIMLCLLVPARSQAEVVYSDWSAWQTTPIAASETTEVETRVVDVMGTKTQYFYEYWRYYNNSAGRYFYKGNGNLGGDYYSVTMDYKLKFYMNTSDGKSYLLGGGNYINFSRELWFNEKEVQTPVVTGQQTEYRYRTIISSGAAATPTSIITPAPAALSTGTPGAISDLYIFKSEFYEDEDIEIYWTSAENAYEYGLTVREYPYTSDTTIRYNQRLTGNRAVVGKLSAGNYRFAMRAYNSNGEAGPVSAIIYFSVIKRPFTALSTDKQVYLCGEFINTSWTPVTNADKYMLHASDGKLDLVNSPVIAATTSKFGLLVAGTYKVWVTAEQKGKTIYTFDAVNISVRYVLIEQEKIDVTEGYNSSLTLQYVNDYIDLSKVSYMSSDQNIATVDLKGNVAGKIPGQVIISVMYNGKEMDTCTVTVKEDIPRLPVDASLGSWYVLTYAGHDTGYKWQYSATDWNLEGNKDKGTPVYAIQSGTVTYSKNGSIRIKHDKALTLVNGYRYETWNSWYSHMANIVAKNTYVKKGDIIGYISKINADTEHLHFVIHKGTNDGTNDAISPYWLQGDYHNEALYAKYRNPELYKTLIFRAMPE